MKALSLLFFSVILLMPLHGEDAPLTAKQIAHQTQKRINNLTLYFRGQRTFERMCEQCHGRTGRGNGPWAETMTIKPRNLRSGTFKFRTTPYGKLPTDSDLRRTIRAGISGTAMPTFAKMSANELDGIITYVQSLSRRWQDEANYALPISQPAPPDGLKDRDAIKDHIAKGRVLFGKTCASCHGTEGKGNGPASKGLIDVWKNPIIPADLTRAHYKSGNTSKDLYRTISTGLDGTPMIGFHPALKSGEIWNLVAFVSSLQKAKK
jgi:mono/diheme cytochrome c family protein